MIEDGILVGKDDVSSPEADEQGSSLSAHILRWTSGPTPPRAAPHRATQTPYRTISLLSPTLMKTVPKKRVGPSEARTRPVIPHPKRSEDGKGRKRPVLHLTVPHQPMVTEPRHAPIPRVQGISVLAVNVHRVCACLPSPKVGCSLTISPVPSVWTLRNA